MNPLRFGTTVSAIALASVIAGCAAPMSRSASVAAGKANMAYALRAQMALGSGDYASAISFAEQAAEASPEDATIRGLLGNAYFGAGRFASAEAAYTDSLSLIPTQPQLILKRALVQIAQGKNAEAIAGLQSAQGMIDPADYGLALALAGQPYEAVQVLEVAARAQGADARVRQNLALAHALTGDWDAARTIAAQDLSPDLVDARVQHWMTLAKPAHSYDQVAALVGVSPAASDPGQPVRVALNKSDTRMAEAVPAPVQLADAAPVQSFVASDAPAFATPVSQPDELAPTPTDADDQLEGIAAAAAISPEAPAAFAAMASSFAPKAETAKAKKPAAAHPVQGSSKTVVQLGAYSSEERVAVAWDRLTRRFPTLRNYSPVSARFDSPRGTVYRLSVRGFANQQEALSRCRSLRGKGGSCFVRSTAGDSPVQFASR
jgi:D-alanyl-D-alanine carboxypeptidase